MEIVTVLLVTSILGFLIFGERWRKKKQIKHVLEQDALVKRLLEVSPVETEWLPDENPSLYDK